MSMQQNKTLLAGLGFLLLLPGLTGLLLLLGPGQLFFWFGLLLAMASAIAGVIILSDLILED